jgi:hypothetical protein
LFRNSRRHEIRQPNSQQCDVRPPHATRCKAQFLLPSFMSIARCARFATSSLPAFSARLLAAACGRSGQASRLARRRRLRFCQTLAGRRPRSCLTGSPLGPLCPQEQTSSAGLVRSENCQTRKPPWVAGGPAPPPKTTSTDVLAIRICRPLRSRIDRARQSRRVMMTASPGGGKQLV